MRVRMRSAIASSELLARAMSSCRYADVERSRSAKPSPSNRCTDGTSARSSDRTKPPGSLGGAQPASVARTCPRAVDHPVGVAGGEALMEIGGCGVDLGSPGRRTTTFPSNAIHPPGRTTSCARRQPIDGSTQCQADAATRTSKRRPRSSQFSTRTSRPRRSGSSRAAAGERRHALAGLDRGRPCARARRAARRLPGAAADLEHRPMLVQAR